MKKKVITISRQFGSGGRSIGAAVAKKLNIAFYDRELIEKIALETGFLENFVKEKSEYASSGNSLLFNIVMTCSVYASNTQNPADTIYFAQSKLIKELAEKESCVIVGRCSDYILRERSDCIHIFICADKESRANRIIQQYGETDKSIYKRIDDKDTRRKLYYSHYTDRVWGAPQNYHMTLNSSALGEDVCIDTIVNLFEKLC